MAATTAVAQPRPANDHFSLSSRPTCPSVLIPFEQQLYALPVQRLDVQAEFNVSTAFIKITGVWRNIANYKSDCLFVLPLNGTVTSVNIKINQRIFETIIIPKDEAEKMRREDDKEKKEGKRKTEEKEKVAAAEGDDKKSGQLPPMSFEEYIPNLFRLPIPGVASTDYITVSVVYIEPLYFSNGQYHFTLPLTFGANLVPAKKTIGDILTLRCIINSVSPMTRWECKSHELKCTKSAYARVELEAINLNQRYEGDAKSKEAKKASSNNAGGEPQSPSNQPGAPSQPQAATGSVDFSLAYTMTSETILPTLIVQPDDQVQGQPETGNFLLFVTPPSLENKDNFFTRNMVFLLDRSGSMNGEPFQEAIKALRAAVTALRPSDMFTVIAFDHRQEYFRKELVAATEQNIAACKAWTETFAPERGGTDIQAPLEWALQTLEKDSTSNLTLPFVVLLTDGCVGNERIICTKANEYCKKTRVLTFGIGSYCNWFFLKMLAQIGRGFSDVVVYKERIFAQMLQLLNMAAIPVITNVQLSIQGIKGVELYPFPIPDLFMGAPLTIAGRYAGKFPDEVKITGLQSDKSEYAMTIQPRSSEVIPVNKVFIKQRLDLLTARSWLEDSKPLQEQVVDISCTESMPSAYTTMVAYETTEEKRKEMKQERQGAGGAPGENQPLLGGADGKDDSTASLNGGNSGDSATKKQIVLAQAQKKKWYRNPKILGAIAVGNAVLIGAAAFSFGDLAASMSNVPVIGALGDGIGSLASGDCCGDCGSCECDCDCDCGDCLAC